MTLDNGRLSDTRRTVLFVCHHVEDCLGKKAPRTAVEIVLEVNDVDEQNVMERFESLEHLRYGARQQTAAASYANY